MSPSVANSLVWSCRDFDEQRCQQQAVDALDEQHGIYYSVLFVPDACVQGQQLLLAAHSTGYIRVIDWQATNTAWVEHKQQLGCVHSQWRAHSSAVFRLAIHPQAGWLVSAGDDGFVRLWSLAAIAAAAASRPEGDGVPPRAGGSVAELQLAPVAEVQLPHAPQLFGVGSPEQPAAQALALDTQQHRAYVGASDGGCYSIDLQALAAGSQGRQALQPLAGHLAGVLDVSWNAATQQLATGSEDGTLRVWDMATSAVVAAVVPSAGRTLVPGDTSAALGAVEQPAVGAVAHSGDGSFLVAGSSNATLALWDCRTAAIARQQKTERSVPQALLVQPAAIYMAGSAPELHRYSFMLKPQERHALRTRAHCFGLDLEEGRGLLAVGGSRGCLELHNTITGDVAGAVNVPGT